MNARWSPKRKLSLDPGMLPVMAVALLVAVILMAAIAYGAPALIHRIAEWQSGFN